MVWWVSSTPLLTRSIAFIVQANDKSKKRKRKKRHSALDSKYIDQFDYSRSISLLLTLHYIHHTTGVIIDTKSATAVAVVVAVVCQGSWIARNKKKAKRSEAKRKISWIFFVRSDQFRTTFLLLTQHPSHHRHRHRHRQRHRHRRCCSHYYYYCLSHGWLLFYCLRVVTVVVCFKQVCFCEIRNIAIVRVVNTVIKLRIMRVQYVLEPYFSFLSVSTSVPKNTAGQLQLPKHASLRMFDKIEVHF